MPTREEMKRVIDNYCRGRLCSRCVIFNDPSHVLGKCSNPAVPLSVLVHNYNLVIEENEINAQKEKGKEK